MDGPYSIYIISAVAFVAAIALVDGAYLAWKEINIPGRVKMNKRLNNLYASGVSRDEALSLLRSEQYSSNDVLHGIYQNIPRLVLLHRLIEQAGVKLSISRIILIQVTLAVTLYFMLEIFTKAPGIISAVLGISIGFYIPIHVLRNLRNRRRNTFQKQLPDTLDYIARSLRAGNPFPTSIQLVSKEMPEPIASEFGITFDELNFGLDTDHALHGLFERTQSEEIRYFVTAVILQRTTGGNLAEVLNRIAEIIRSRASTVKEVAILAAEMKISAYVLLALPFLVGGAILIFNPGYMNVLFETDIGLIMLAAQAFLMIVGFAIVQKMVNFRV